MRGLNFLVGVTVGVALGALASVLLAPRSGLETKQSLKELTEKTRKRAQELRTRGQQYIESERTHIQEAVEAGRQAAHEKRVQLEQELHVGSAAEV